MVIAVFLSRVLGLVRESIIAAQFGQSAATDVYQAAFKIPDLLYFMIAGGALSSAFVPVFTDYLTKGKDEEAWRIYSTVATSMGLVITVFIILGEIFARHLVPVLAAPGFQPHELDQTAYLTRILLPAQFCFFIGGLTMGTLYARKQFFIPALGPIIYNLGIIWGGIFLAHRFGIVGLTIGALVGAVTGNFLLQIWYSSRLGIRFQLCLDFKHPGVKQVFALMLPVILGLSLVQVDFLINSWFASFLPAGSLSALGYANRLMQLPLGIFGQAAGIAALPALSALASAEKWEEYRDTLSFGVRSVFFFTIPSSLLMMVLARPLIALMFQAGEFTSEDTVHASVAMIYYAIGIFAWGGQALIARGFYALQDTRTPVIIGTIMTAIFIPLNWILMKLMGHGGLALATSIMAILYLIAISYVLARRVKGIGAWRIINSTTRITIASVLCAAVAVITAKVTGGRFNPENTLTVKLAAAVQLLPGLLAGSVAYIAACVALRVEETQLFFGMLRRKLRKTSRAAA